MFSLGKSFLLLSFSCLVTLVVTQETANNEYFPFVVSLKTNPYDEGYQHFCTGSIINSRWILTAAHCILRAEERWLETMVVDVGTEYLSESDNIQRYSVTRIFCHPDVALLPLEKRYDVALIELEEPIAFSSSVSSVGLGTIRDELEVPVVAVGWGYVSDFKFIPDKVRVSELTTDKYEDCQEKHAKEDNIVNKELNICASGSEGNTVCQGMSGGPLVDRRTGLQVGVSSGMKDCTAEFPFLFARIESVIDWINDVTGLGLVLN